MTVALASEALPRADRRAHRVGVEVRSMQGDRAAAAVRDISPFGSNLRIEANWLREGIFVELIGGSGARARAIVRWRRGTGCGVEFLIPHANPRALLR